MDTDELLGDSWFMHQVRNELSLRLRLLKLLDSADSEGLRSERAYNTGF